MPAPLPARMLSTVMAPQAGLVDLGWLDLTELTNVSLIVVVHVRLPGSMAALAPVGGRGGSRVQRLRMGGALERFTLGMTGLARVTADVANLRCGRGLRCRLLLRL